MNNPLTADYLERIIEALSQPVRSSRETAGRAELCRQALSLFSKIENPVLWAHLHVHLGYCLSRSLENNHAQNLDDAICALHSALTFYTKDNFPEEWETTLNDLAILYRKRIRGNDSENIDKSIALYTLLLNVRTKQRSPEQWANTQSNLASAYLHRVQGSRAQNIETAISLLNQALEVYSKARFPEHWARVQHNLVFAYRERIEGNRARNIEAAITAADYALKIYTRIEFPEQWAGVQVNLANAYRERIEGNRAENIEQAITASNYALEIFSRKEFPEQWAVSQNNLATAYVERIRGNHSENIEAAIDRCKQALKVYTKEDYPEKCAATRSNLAAALLIRQQGNRDLNIRESIAVSTLSLGFYSKEAFPEWWADAQTNIARAYRARTEGDRAKNFEEAIASFRRTLEVYSEQSFPEKWARTQIDLGMAYADNNNTSGDRTQKIENSIFAYNCALRVLSKQNYPEQWGGIQINLAGSYRKHTKGDHSQNIELAITAYENALKIFSIEDFPRSHCKALRLLADLYSDEARWIEAVRTYSMALQVAEDIYQSANLTSSQLAELKETDDLYHRAAFAYTQTGSLRTAIVLLEQGRARVLRETLVRDQTDISIIEHQNPKLYERYQTATEQIQFAEMQERANNSQTQYGEILRKQASAARADLRRTIAEIRTMEGYETFLSLPTFTSIEQILQPQQTLVYVVATASGGLALVLFKSSDEQVSTHAIHLPNLSREKLHNLTNSRDPKCWLGAYNNFRHDTKTYLHSWLNAIEMTTQGLWKNAMEPITTFLVRHSVTHATLIPCGLLSMLPLHAAHTPNSATAIDKQYALDTCYFSYSPSASALASVEAVVKNALPRKLLAINNPTQDLKNSEQEIAMAISQFESHKMLAHEDATREAVLAAIPNYSVIHFACHGLFYPVDPLESRLKMAGKADLTLRDFFNTSLKGVRLAILSACETGVPSLDVPDEVMSLSTGLLQAGVAGIISTLWSVSDLSTAFLLVKFYDLWQTRGYHVATALHKAQVWLRDSTTKEMLQYLTPSLSGDGQIPQKVANWFYEKLRANYDDLESRPFQHPFYWAAFTYVGAQPPHTSVPSSLGNAPYLPVAWKTQISSRSQKSFKPSSRLLSEIIPPS